MVKHIVQSPIWGEFKSKYGTSAVRVENIQYTLHKIPFTQNNIAYCPKVNPFEIKWDRLEHSLNDNSCISINFDIPNVLKGSKKEASATALFKEKCVRSPKDTFAKFNIILDMRKSEKKILEEVHSKRRYNIKYAQKKGIQVKCGKNAHDFEIFYKLLKEASDRQGYYIHPQNYYKKIWQTMAPKNMCHLLIAECKNEPLVAWMLFSYDSVLYYPYGGSSTLYRKFFPSDLVGWEAIRLGKKLGCHTFDMWGAAKDPGNKSDPWWGFTNFKLKYGGEHVEYINSYDFVINKGMYNMFTIANDVRWKILNAIK